MTFFLTRLLLAVSAVTVFPIAVAAVDTMTTVAPASQGRVMHGCALLPNGKLLVTGGSSTKMSPGEGLPASTTEIFDPVTGTWAEAALPPTFRKYGTTTVLPNGKVLNLWGLAHGGNGWTYSFESSIYNPATNTWTSLPWTGRHRYQHVAVLLHDGRVLVIGGYGDSGNATETFNPATNTWTTTASTTLTFNTGHTAALLPDGKVFVLGASSGDGTEIYDPVTGNWSSGPAATARFRHTATLLPNGKVLIAGGSTSTNITSPLNTAELYDPVTNTLSPTGALTTARSAHSATLLPNGKVAVIGGQNNIGPLASVEIYDPATETWSTSTATLTKARRFHTATLLPDGRVAVTAGADSAENGVASMEIFSSSTPAWSSTGNMGTWRGNVVTVMLPDGRVLVPGGYTDRPLNTAEVYDPVAGTWSSAGTMVSGHSEGTVTLLPNGKVLLAGNSEIGTGNRAELYDPVAGTWTAAPNMVVERIRHTATLLPSGKVLAAGGGIAFASTNTSLYDPGTNTWTTTGSLGTARNFHGGTLLPDGRVLASGGTYAWAMDAYATCELYNPGTGTWTSTGTLNEKRCRHTSTLLPNGKVLVTGGAYFPSYMQVTRATAELFDPATGTWSFTGSMASARVDHRAELLPDGRVMVAGGGASVEIYDPTTGTWSAGPSMSAARSGLVLLTTGKVLSAGGASSGSVVTELYDTGLGYMSGSRPQVSTAALDIARLLTITGSNLRGVSSGSTGGIQDSSAAFPVVQLRSLGNSQVTWAPVAGWSATGFTSGALPANFAPGHMLMTVFTNGIPSVSKVVVAARPPEISIEHPAGTNLADGGSQSFGSVANGTGSPLTFTIKNTGDSALAVSGVSVTGGNAADFVVSTTGMSSSVAGGDSTTFSVTFTPSATGSRTTTLQIFSDDNDEATFDITLTGTGLNTAPTITDIADQTIDEDAATSALMFTIGDLETAAASLTVTRSSSNTTLVPLANVVLGSSGANRIVSVTPAANLSGTATITVTVSDGAASTSDTFLLTVNAVNDTPTLNSITNPTAILEDAAQQTVNLSGISAGGGESQTLTVVATSDNTALIPHPLVAYTSAATTGSIRYTPAANMSGSAVITVTVDDGQALNNVFSRSFTVNVMAANDPPTLDAISNPAAILEDSGQQSIGLSGISAGPNESQTLIVTAFSNNPAIVPHPTVTYTSGDAIGTLSYTPVPNASGSTTITVSVYDGQASNNTFSRTFTVAVSGVNDAPTLNSISSPAAILEDASQQTIGLSGITAGPGGESQALTITAISDNPAVIPNPTVVYTSPSTTGSLRYTPVPNVSGTATITVTVNDGQAADNTITQIFTVIVNAVNDPPTLDAIGNPAAILEDAGIQTINLTGISSGPNESQSLVITAVSSNTALIPHPVVASTTPNASLSYTPVADANGTAIITVTVNDGQASNNTFSRSFTVAVTAVNDAPTLNNVSSASTAEDTSSTPISFTVNDLETSPGALTLSGSATNTALVPNANITFGGSGQNRTVTVTPATNQFGTTVIAITVSDGSLTATDIFQLTVSAVNDAPTISILANQVITYNTLTNALNFTIGDIETASPLLVVTGASSNQALLPDSSIYLGGSGAGRDVTLVPQFNQTGESTITLSVTDGSATTTTSFMLTVNAPEIVVEQPFGSNLADGGSRSFGSVDLGSTASLVFYIKNTNAASLTGLGITKDGPNASQFIIAASPVAPVVGPSGNTAFTVQFAPTSGGNKTATLHIANNDPNEHPFDITLNGRGITSRPHWREAHFGSAADSGNAADLADPDNDGLPNMLEYALGMNPGQSSNGQVPQAQLFEGALVLVFDQPEEVTDIVYSAEWNATLDPAGWTSTGINHVFNSGEHIFTLPLEGRGRAWMRLKIMPATP